MNTPDNQYTPLKGLEDLTLLNIYMFQYHPGQWQYEARRYCHENQISLERYITTSCAFTSISVGVLFNFKCECEGRIRGEDYYISIEKFTIEEIIKKIDRLYGVAIIIHSKDENSDPAGHSFHIIKVDNTYYLIHSNLGEHGVEALPFNKGHLCNYLQTISQKYRTVITFPDEPLVV